MKMKKLIYVALLLTPTFAFAALQNITDIVTALKGILGLLIPMAFGLAVLFFFYGVALYILAAGDPKKAGEGKSIMIYGIIALAVMASVWGITIWLQQTLGINNQTTVTPPGVTGIN